MPPHLCQIKANNAAPPRGVLPSQILQPTSSQLENLTRSFPHQIYVDGSIALIAAIEQVREFAGKFRAQLVRWPMVLCDEVLEGDRVDN